MAFGLTVHIPYNSLSTVNYVTNASQRRCGPELSQRGGSMRYDKTGFKRCTASRADLFAGPCQRQRGNRFALSGPQPVSRRDPAFTVVRVSKAGQTH
jgi:hypothetical protein